MKRSLTLIVAVLTAVSVWTPALATHETDNRFLDTLRQVSGDADEGVTQVNGQALPHSLSFWSYCEGSDDVEFNLSRDWTRFTATVGLDDDSNANDPLYFEVYEDGQLTWSKMISLGASAQLDLDVSNVLRLRLVVTKPEDTCEDTQGVFGNASLSRPMAHQQERAVSLSLTEHLRATGVVDVLSEVPQCASSLTVKIQRYDYSWATVAETTTASDGSFSVALRDRKGKYRAVALASEVGATYPEHVCLKAKSPAVRHGH